MKTFFRSVAMLLGLGLLPVAAHAQKKVIIEDEEPNSVMFVSTNKAGDEIIRIMNAFPRTEGSTLCTDRPTRKIRTGYWWICPGNCRI